MHIPVAIVLGGDTPLGILACRKFYERSCAVLLSGSDRKLLRSTHSQLFNSGWVELHFTKSRGRASGQQCAEIAKEKFPHINWLFCVIELSEDEEVPSQENEDLPKKLESATEEAAAAFKYFSHSTSAIVAVVLKSGGPRWEGKVREWVETEQERLNQTLRQEGPDCTFLVWRIPEPGEGSNAVGELADTIVNTFWKAEFGDDFSFD